jgi:hypothetical protein
MGQSGVLSLSDVVPIYTDPTDPNSTPLTVLEILQSKHPPPQPVFGEAIVDFDSEAPDVHPVVIDKIDAKCIRTAALNTFGAGGPSRTDARHCWRRLCTSYNKSSDELCQHYYW